MRRGFSTPVRTHAEKQKSESSTDNHRCFPANSNRSVCVCGGAAPPAEKPNTAETTGGRRAATDNPGTEIERPSDNVAQSVAASLFTASVTKCPKNKGGGVSDQQTVCALVSVNGHQLYEGTSGAESCCWTRPLTGNLYFTSRPSAALTAEGRTCPPPSAVTELTVTSP